MQRYIALVHKSGKNQYGVMFPDFAGCIAGGSTPDNALDNAREALAFHVEGMRQDKEKIPSPRSLSDIRAAKEDWIEWRDAIVAFVPLSPAHAQQERINVMIDKQLLRVADKRAKSIHQSRSALINTALETYLGA